MTLDAASADDVRGPLWKDVGCSSCGGKVFYIVTKCSIREARIQKKGERRFAEIIIQERFCCSCDTKYLMPDQKKGGLDNGPETKILPFG